MKTPLIDRLIRQLESLSEDKQRRVLEFVQSLEPGASRGVPGDRLLRFAGTIPPQELDLMSEAIENGCEQVGGRIH